MASPRMIDQDERVRKKPMRVLVLGMCRTGTTSMSVALRKLNYTPHQMRDVLARPKDLALWEEAINVTLLSPQDRLASQQGMQPYGRQEFDKLLGDYDAVMDLPSCVFAQQLIEAYPEAKVILTKRRYEDWEHSMQESIWCLDTWRVFTLCRTLNASHMAPLMRLVHKVFKVHNNNTYGGPLAKAAYEKHYDSVRSLVPKRRLLELDTDAEVSWTPICEFLGEKAPAGAYPQLGDEKAMRKNLEKAWWSMLMYFVSMVVLPGFVILSGVWFYFLVGDLRALRDEWILKPLRAYLDG